MTLQNSLQALLSNPAVLVAWALLVSISLKTLIWDLQTNNAQLGRLMKYVWGLTVLYSGPLGLTGYYLTGRTQIKTDSIYRRGFRSVAHCYSGCGAGEIIGLTLAIGVLSLTTTGTVILTFTLAFTFGYALTVGPLLEDGVSLNTALEDAFTSETASIAVMEVVAISVDLWIAGDAPFVSPLFFGGLIFSLSIGLLAAYPVNILLIKYGVKDGMMNPQKMRDDTTHSN